MCRKEQGMKKTKELILRAVEKTAQKKLIMDSERWRSEEHTSELQSP